MTVSLPSKKIAIVDVPEIEKFSCEFSYNFFSPDEKTNDSGANLAQTSNGSDDSSFLTRVVRVSPRFVKLSWKPNNKGEKGFIANNVSIREHLKKIHNEETFTSSDFTNTFFQDTQLDGKASFFIKEAIEHIEESRPEKEKGSPLDVVKSINKKTGKEISGTFLADVFNNLKAMGIGFVDSKTKKEIIQNSLSELSNVRTRIQFNNKFLKNMLRSAEEDPASFFSDEAAKLHKAASSIQDTAIADNPSSIFRGHDYDFEIIDYLGYKNIDADGFDPIIQIVGYVIDKEEIDQNGRIIAKEPIIVENPIATTAIDTKVKYGATYSYKIRSIAYMEFQAEDGDANSVISVSFLVSSRPTPIQTVLCNEMLPPPWPADFNVDWDYHNRSARLTWSFPVNPQRDIKKFQVFRRASILEPFELIKMYDFDDSEIKSPYYEVPEAHLVETIKAPKTYFLDKEFNVNSTYIYAVCSIDAHGFTSNYSPQFEVSFDKFKNKITKKLISSGGAPKQYPNMYLREDTFVDVIKTSGYNQLKVYFNPEFLKVVDNDGNDLKVIKTANQGASYKLQLTNVDLQAQKTIDITIDDKRKKVKI